MKGGVTLDSLQNHVINEIAAEYAKGHSYTEQYVVAYNQFIDSLSFDNDDSYKKLKLKIDYLDNYAIKELLLKCGYTYDPISNKYKLI